MSEFPTGSQRFTSGGVLGTSGQAKYITVVSMACEASTGGVITLHNSTSASSTANIYATFYGIAGSSNVYDFSELYFPSGCYVHCSANSGVQYAVIEYRETKI